MCPDRNSFLRGNEAYRDFYRNQRAAGKNLEFYSPLGPTRLLDPHAHYRLSAWSAWREGATAISFWAFSDNGGSSSWNEYVAPRTDYSPLFLDPSSVVSSKKMAALREGVEDFEYLRMLSEAIVAAQNQGADATLIAAAQNLLTTSPDTVLVPAGTLTAWQSALDRSVADRQRLAILDALISLTP